MRMVRAVAALLLLPLLLGVTALPAQAGDPRWRFYTEDKTPYVSPWYARAHLIMVPFGCTSAPYYSPDSRCSNGRGFHHGLDIAMKCGTRLFAGHRMWVMSNDSLGPAYGTDPLLLRNRKLGFDLVIGHTRTVYVSEGDLVKKGELFARASDNGAPDGCHLHFEKRAVGGGLSTATRPRRLLGLTPRGE